MTMTECDVCGDDLQTPRDKAGGWWRDRCLPRIREETPDIPDTAVVDTIGYQQWVDKRTDEPEDET